MHKRQVFILLFSACTLQLFAQYQAATAGKSGSVKYTSHKKDTFPVKTGSSMEIKERNFQDVYSRLSGLLDEKKFSAFATQMRKAQQQFPGNAKLLELKKQFVIRDYQVSILGHVQLSNDKYFEKRPVFASCQAGTVNSAGHQLVLQRINYARRLAGLYDSCVFDPALNSKCQQAAMMMDVNNTLDHSPKSNWKCYTRDGAAAAGNSNLSYGYTFADAIIGQLEDGGSGNSACGHRRWILNPYNNVFGHGSTFNAMTLYVFGSSDTRLVKKTGFVDSQYICWPAADFFPLDLVPERWSFSLANANFNQAKISVTLNGKPLRVRMEPVKEGYAINTVVWTIGQPVQANQVYTVSISNVKIVSGWGRQAVSRPARTFTYRVTPLNIK